MAKRAKLLKEQGRTITMCAQSVCVFIYMCSFYTAVGSQGISSLPLALECCTEHIVCLLARKEKTLLALITEAGSEADKERVSIK